MTVGDTASAREIYEFGPFRIDPERAMLLRAGQPVPLTPKTFQILLVLVRRSQEVVTKDDLMKAVWPDTFVEEANLSRSIFMLRKALGETPRTTATSSRSPAADIDWSSAYGWYRRRPPALRQRRTRASTFRSGKTGAEAVPPLGRVAVDGSSRRVSRVAASDTASDREGHGHPRRLLEFNWRPGVRRNLAAGYGRSTRTVAVPQPGFG
jgi:hypothetical protein